MKNKKNLFKVAAIAIAAMVMTAGFTSCSKKETVNASSQSPKVEAEPEDTPLETYPSDYRIAYFNLIGITPAPTVRDLFGSNAKFLTSFQGMPAVVTLEKVSGTANEFNCQLLLTVKVPEKDDMKVARMIVTFESDNLSEMSYCRYINIVNLMTGSKTEERSTGSQKSDAGTLAFFAGVMEMFWE